jgi:hypothetical protein
MKPYAAHKILTFFFLGMGLILSGINCKSILGSDDEFEARVLIYNNCGATLDIYLDSDYRFTLAAGNTETISDLTEEVHKLDAFLTGTQTLVLTESFDATKQGDYEWTIDGQATIAVRNEFGETVLIYENAEYLGYLEDNDTATIPDVPFGSFYFEITTLENSNVIASTSIEVTEIKEYSWVIK